MRNNLPALLLLAILVIPLPLALLFTGTNGPEMAVDNQYALSEDALFIRGPTVNMVTNHSAVIFWRTDGLANATVHYGLNMSVVERVDNTTLDTDHRLQLEGLGIDSKYYYKVASNGTESELYHFKTAPPDGAEFKIIIIGDNRPASVATQQPEEYRQLVQMIVEEEPHLILHTGDFVLDVTTNHEANLAAWAAFNNVTDIMGHYAPIYAVLGNHDTGAKTGGRLLEYFFDAFEQYDEPSTYFSFDYAGVHFIGIDTEEYGIQGRIIGDQYDWLVNDLETTSRDMKFIFGHRPMYPINHYRNSLDIEPDERDALQALFETHNVTAYICGHDHSYNRMTVNGLVHIISGGGGAPLVSTPWGGAFHHYMAVNVSSSKVSIAAIDLSGSVRDTYELPYEGPIEIFLRVLANTSTKYVGSMPEIYFSEAPAEKYYSWDSGENQTVLTGIPDTNGLHTLDVYARDSEGIWSSAYYEFTAVGAPVTTTTTTPTTGGLDPLLLFGAAAVAGVVIVIVLIWIRKR